jgi:signal transduction histidine kinase
MKLDVDKASDFLALFAHDLRGTLGSIKSFAELVEYNGPLNEQQQRWLQRVYANVERGLTTLSDMLLLSELSEQQFDARPVELRPLIQEALQYVENLLIEKNLVVQVDIGVDAHELVCDPRWFRHVLYNLLSNAAKYNHPEGSIYIEAWPGQNAVFLRITDTGQGIPQEALARIFEKFYRVSSGKSSGSGLGLSIVREIVERHGGVISVESEPGKGTSFTLQMPLLGLARQHESGEDLDALDDNAQEGADNTDYDDPSSAAL